MRNKIKDRGHSATIVQSKNGFQRFAEVAGTDLELAREALAEKNVVLFEVLMRLAARGFNIYKDRHGIQRCYHRKSATPINLKRYSYGSPEFLRQCEMLMTLHGTGDRTRDEFVYLITDGPLVKIGYSKDVDRRLRDLQTSTGHNLSVTAYMKGTRQDEKALHRRFKAHRAKGEWFRIEGRLADFMADPVLNLSRQIRPPAPIVDTRKGKNRPKSERMHPTLSSNPAMEPLFTPPS